LDPLELLRPPSLMALTRRRARLAVGLVNRSAAFRRDPSPVTAACDPSRMGDPPRDGSSGLPACHREEEMSP
jgi:hypothetical protein